jgi:IS1 family transposase
MNKLPLAKRVQILSMLVEGSSMRSISRVADVSINTVSKLLCEAGEACLAIHDETVRGVKSSRVQCDEIWSFCYAKEKNAKVAKAAPEGAGDVWTWTALDADSKLIVSYFVGDRSGQSAIALMDDLRARIENRVQLTTDGHRAYLEAVEGAFGGDIDYAMLNKIYGPTIAAPGRYSPAECIGTQKKRIEGNPDAAHVSTSYVERQNLTMRMSMRASPASPMRSARSSTTTFTRWRSTSPSTTSAAYIRRCACPRRWQRGSRIDCGRWRISLRRSTRWPRLRNRVALTKSAVRQIQTETLPEAGSLSSSACL